MAVLIIEFFDECVQTNYVYENEFGERKGLTVIHVIFGTASMTARRITTEEEAKAALAERRRRAREVLERQAELEKQR